MWQPTTAAPTTTVNLAKQALKSAKLGQPSQTCSKLSRCCCCSLCQNCRVIPILLAATAFFVAFPILFLPCLLLRWCTWIPLPAFVPAWAHKIFKRGTSITISELPPPTTTAPTPTSKNPKIETPNHWVSFPFGVEPPQIIFFGRNNTVVPSSTFDPQKNTLLYVHGYERGTTCRGFRETMDTPTGVDFDNTYPVLQTGNLWLDQEYNICIFYWNQFSDEPDIEDCEKKIYTKGPHRCARKSSNSHCGSGPETVSFHMYGTSTTPSISRQLCKEYNTYFDPQRYQGKVLMCGHSMGGQLVIEAARELLQLDNNNRLNSSGQNGNSGHVAQVFSLTKLVVLDPFFSSGTKPFISTTTAQRATDTLKQIATQHPSLILETQITSLIGEGWLGSHCTGLQDYTNYRVIDLPDMCWMHVKERHCIAHHLFMCEIVKKRDQDEKEKSTGATRSGTGIRSVPLVRVRAKLE